MARNLRILVVLLFLSVLVVHHGPSHSQQRDNMVRQRLMADLQDLKNQLTQLNKTVNQLQNTVSNLRRENQRNKNRIQKLEQKIDELKAGGVSDKTSRNQSSSDLEVSSVGDRVEGSNGLSEDVWVEDPDEPYTIRREPLDHEVIIVTTHETTLTKLAHRYYRDASFWDEIFEYNKDKLPSPNVVPPGIKLTLPAVEKLK